MGQIGELFVCHVNMASLKLVSRPEEVRWREKEKVINEGGKGMNVIREENMAII